ncbi:unnamed protein product (macronuclear) [Paramecium tetraurelia]|uniref:Uncharacterized protein n=1 Tax=Paramecium tetraurelia TaxID=5888 RepID=A0C1V5_PARTE|nr:uncharacterized protein GSPATT00034249001 [Paramecium tetraurelia]CAK64772.1 unnamed protein product [Paramecium tetraurelia]|eukprot:XP_001432169.1 hypothetical protein (macronuclear) [Paramecium tetraurelia strain d4-2]
MLQVLSDIRSKMFVAPYPPDYSIAFWISSNRNAITDLQRLSLVKILHNGFKKVIT